MELVKSYDPTVDVTTLSNEDLLAELAASLEVTARHLVRLSTVWTELERRGVDLRELRSGLRAWLPLVAAGKLAAEAVVQFAGQVALLRALAEMPLARQRELARGDPVVVVTFGSAGGFSSEKLPAHRLTQADVALVFDKGHERTSEEQIPVLQDRLRSRQRRTGGTITLNLSAVEYQAVKAAADAKRIRVATLVTDLLREHGVLPCR